LHSIVSFGANQVFADKTTYTCLLILNKKPQNTFQYAEVKSLNSWKVREPEAVKYTSKKTKELDREVWVLVSPELTTAYNKIVTQSEKLVDLIGDENIFNGIQTSANDVYIFTPTKEDKKHYFFSKKGIEYKIEKEITKPYFKTSSGEDNLYTYRTFKPNARVVYPYTPTRTGVDVIPLTTIQKKFPLAYDYLQANKPV
jgi:type I restriction-modification system DNA methylase subunit